MFHFRESHGRQEVDLLLESADGRVVALEIKARHFAPGKGGAPTVMVA